MCVCVCVCVCWEGGGGVHTITSRHIITPLCVGFSAHKHYCFCFFFLGGGGFFCWFVVFVFGMLKNTALAGSFQSSVGGFTIYPVTI